MNKSLLLVFILLFISGNNIANVLLGQFLPVTFAIIIYAIIGVTDMEVILKNPLFIKLFNGISLFLLVLTFLQLIILGSVSYLGNLNLLVKVFIGGVIIFYLGRRFPKLFFDVVYILSLISLVFFVVINLLHISLPYIQLEEEFKTYILYNTSYDIHLYKNEGMFWEPGAHAGILTLCLALNTNRFQFLIKNEPFKLFIIILTLISTQSTTGYLILIILMSAFFFELKNYFVLFFIFPFFILSAVIAYETLPFLQEKVETQFAERNEDNGDEINNSRFGSFEFDYYYIKKHPIVGNGLSEVTRYADHQSSFSVRSGGAKNIGNGNGFSNYLACMGLPFVMGYFILLYRNSKITNELNYFVVVIIVFLNMWGEQWFNYPLFVGLPFLFFNKSGVSEQSQSNANKKLKRNERNIKITTIS